jgi:hypothetical protein
MILARIPRIPGQAGISQRARGRIRAARVYELSKYNSLPVLGASNLALEGWAPLCLTATCRCNVRR